MKGRSGGFGAEQIAAPWSPSLCSRWLWVSEPRDSLPKNKGEAERGEPITRRMLGAGRPLTRAPLPQPW